MKSTELRSFLTGLILGDGTIDSGISKRSFRIKSISHDFIDYIERSLRETTNFNIVVREFSGSTKNGTIRQPYKELIIKAHPYFNKRYHFFYDDYRNRRITKEVLKWLSPIGLANWYMSNGYIIKVGKESSEIKDRRVEIATDRYKKDDVEKIRDYFETEYGFSMKLVKRKEGMYRLRFSLLSAQHFFLMIEPYIVPSMRYKILLPYDYQPKWMADEYYSLIKPCKCEES